MLSFIIPAYNEELELPATIHSIRAAAKDQDHEIVVVDDASSDRTAEVARGSGARLVSINRRQIAAARNAGGRAAQGDVLFFVDADTHINEKHVRGALGALEHGFAGGSARVNVHEPIPFWAKICLHLFSTVYFGLNLGAGAFLFTTRRNFERIGGFDENIFVGEEIYFSLALRKHGRFTILREPIVTSGRKLRMYSAREIWRHSFRVIFRGRRAVRTRDGLEIWYDGRREEKSVL